MITKNAIEKANKVKVPTQFSISADQIAELYVHYPDAFEYGFMCFKLGYLQGMRSINAELKKNGGDI